MEVIAYTHAAMAYEASQPRLRRAVAPKRNRRLSFHKVMAAATLALTVMALGLAGTVLSPLGVEANVPLNLRQ
jgi:hypothetical protein